MLSGSGTALSCSFAKGEFSKALSWLVDAVGYQLLVGFYKTISTHRGLRDSPLSQVLGSSWRMSWQCFRKYEWGDAWGGDDELRAMEYGDNSITWLIALETLACNSSLIFWLAVCRPSAQAPVLAILAGFGISYVQFFSVYCCSIEVPPVFLFGTSPTPPVWREWAKTSTNVLLPSIQWINNGHSLIQVSRLTNNPRESFSATYDQHLFAFNFFVAALPRCSRGHRSFSVFPKFPV